jgi:hypothetical protein
MAELQEGIKLIIDNFDSRFLTFEAVFLIFLSSLTISFLTLQAKKIKEKLIK